MITVFIGHSGDRLSLDPSLITDLDALKALVSQHGILPRHQILLTPSGKQARNQTLLTETELFVFDSSRLNNQHPTSPSTSSLAASDASDFSPGTAPDAISNQTNLQAWQNLFRLRKSWASGLLNGCDSRARQAEKYQDEQLVIERSLGVAVASLQQHVKSAEQKFVTAESWAHEVLQQQHVHAGDWEENLERLERIPARAEFMKFIQPLLVNSKVSSQQRDAVTLQAFVDAASIKNAADTAGTLVADFEDKVGKIRADLDNVVKERDDLLRAVDQISANSVASNTSEPAQLLEEIEIVVKKMTADLEHVQSLPNTSQSVTQVSKMALLHTRNYLPNLSQYCVEMNEAVRRAQQQRNGAADTAMEHMRHLASIESDLAELFQNTKNLETPPDGQNAFSTLRIVSRLPSVYGALLIESLRRREWVAKMKRDAGTLQEEVATYQDEEDKRRKKWVRTVEDVAKSDALRSSVLGIELSLQNEGGSWPMVTRDELHEHLKVLQDVYGPCALTDEMDQAIKDLDKPTRKQIKLAKAFKNGSMHEAAFGDTSLLLRGDEQHKALREINLRLEEDLKGQKSRVRKLEDLLHRSSTIGRANTGDMFTPHSGSSFERNLPSPVGINQQPSDESMPHSQQRKQSMQLMEEKRLARRVVDLEAELEAARNEVTSRKNSDAEFQKQVEEATLTKRDLMDNMATQQKEFAAERRTLERELAEAKEEIERLVGSRDDERTGTDARLSLYEQEVARLKQEAADHAARTAGELHTRTSAERRLDAAETARHEAEIQLQKMRMDKEQDQEVEAERMQLLGTVHSSLSPGTEIPEGISAICTALEELSRRSVSHAKDLEEAIALAKSENQSLWTSNERQKNELTAAVQKQADAEADARRGQERLDSEEAKTSSLEQQLREEQEQLRLLRNKFADGETGSEVLRQRAAEEEARAGKLSADLAEARSHINSLDVELMRLQKKHDALQQDQIASSEWLGRRAEHAKDLSHRLFAQNSRLGRLLERLGLVVNYQDQTMTIERASKLSSSTTMIDTQGQLNRTVSLASPPLSRKSSAIEEPSDLSALRWSNAASMEEENAQFEAFSQQISRFNVDTCIEAVVKRVRDFEYTARKYNKEAKESGKRADAYKDRSIKLKSEAHAKIAVKDFKEGDLALFLPTRGQAKGAWAAFNIGCPHYFLAEKEGMRLANRDFIVARINKIEQKVVDLSKTMPQPPDRGNADETAEGTPSFMDDDNPFDLSDGLTWWLIHATEERGASGAPSTPGLGRSTVAAAAVDAKAIRVQRNSNDNASERLNKTLDSRRSSSASTKKGVAGIMAPVTGATANAGAVAVGSQSALKPLPLATGSSGLGITSTEADAQSVNQQVRRHDLLLGP